MPERTRIEATVDRIASYILHAADYSRRDRLWPAHYSVFSTNPLSVAYGACGNAEFLRRAFGEVPEEVVEWILDQPITVHDYAPGIFVGLAGIAYELHRLGREPEAEQVMATCFESPLLFDDPTMFFGIAGWGLVSLYFHQRTGNPLYRDRVAEACDRLLTTAVESDEGIHWIHAMDETIHYGYGYGASGIGLFLLRAGLALGRRDAVHAARRALDYDLANRYDTLRGWSWPDRAESSLSLPYWGHGAAGVGTAAIRFHHALGDDRYAEAARSIADSAFCKWTILPSQVEGVSGIAEFMLDMFDFTGEQEYRDRAATIADTILWYAIERPNGIVFPGRWLSRVSTDFATGSAGIGLFLLRLVRRGPRFLVDMDDPVPSNEATPPLPVVAEAVPV